MQFALRRGKVRYQILAEVNAHRGLPGYAVGRVAVRNDILGPGWLGGFGGWGTMRAGQPGTDPRRCGGLVLLDLFSNDRGRELRPRITR